MYDDDHEWKTANHLLALPHTYTNSDVPMKQLIKHLDPEKRIVIYDLDDTHLFIDANYVKEVKKEIETFVDKHVYAPVEEADKRAAAIASGKK